MAAKRKRRGKGNYYGTEKMTWAERADLGRARRVSGLLDEIALLRTWVKKAVDAEDGEELARAQRELKIVAKGVETLQRAVATQQRVAPRASRELADNIARTIGGIGDQLFPPDR